MTTDLLLAGAALLAGIMNSMAGGGSLVTFPALVFIGVPSIIANASSTVALFPGGFASAWAYRGDLKSFPGVSLRAMLIASIAGGLCGAILLLLTPQTTFDLIIPWLLLLATLAFAFSRRVAPALKRIFHISPAALIGIQFVVSIYGGYFGGAVGLLMLAIWSIYGVNDITAMNAKKTLLGGSMNAAAVVCFVAAAEIWWYETAIMMAGAILGGYAGARVARRANPIYVRYIITTISVITTVAFFIRNR